jgi:hypothetical protein
MADDIVNWDEAPEEAGNGLEHFSAPGLVITGAPGAGKTNPDDEVATLVQYNPEGQEVVTEINFSSPALDADSAREITERIKTTTNVLYMLVKRAHAGKAYIALGYDSFEKYVRAEFDFSKVYAYRLINQANFIAAIEEKLPEGAQIHVSEPVSTKLKKALPELLEEIEERVEGIEDPEDAGAVIEDIIRERREQEKANNFLNDEEGEELAEPPFQGTGAGNGAPANQWEDESGDVDLDDEDDADFEDEVENSNDVRRKFDKIYNLYSGLKNISSVGEGDELVSFLPRERWSEFNELFKSVVPWLIDFQEQFETYIKEQEEESPAGEAGEDLLDDMDA